MRGTASKVVLVAAAAAVAVSCASGERLLQEAGIATVGIGAPVLISEASSIGSGSANVTFSTSSTTADDELVEALEADSQVTVVSVSLGALVCDDLVNAEDAALLSFYISSTETITAEQLSYTVGSGDTFTDGTGRKVWTGTVTDPEQGDDEAVPRTVSMTWGDACSVETFLFKVTKSNLDGTSTIVKTVPCEVGSTLDICLVEIVVEFDEPAEALIPDDLLSSSAATSESDAVGASANVSTSSAARRLRGIDNANVQRKLQSSTDAVIDVMVLYSTQAMAYLGGISAEQMESYIYENMAWTNGAFINSGIALSFNIVYLGLLPYGETTLDGSTLLSEVRTNADVIALRDLYNADLVQMVGYYDSGSCGIGYVGAGNEAYGFSLVRSSCLDNFTPSHEYGHNMGCRHNRDDSRPALLTEYSHGLRYCDGLFPYRTIMSYTCGSAHVNYFSNPDITVRGRPTGTATEDNARTIEENKAAIAAYRGSGVDPTPAPTPAPAVISSPTPAPSIAPVSLTIDPIAVYPPTNPPTIPPTMPPSALPPTTYTALGCYGDNAWDRVLTGYSVLRDSAMTTERCAFLCDGAAFFGTQYSSECFCGPSTDDPTALGEATCDMECTGDASQTCGGRNALSLYEFDTVTNPDYVFEGCYGDSARSRVLSGDRKLNDLTMTSDVCAQLCVGSPYFGTEYGRECFCAVESDDPTELGTATCDMDCAGDASETCGGRNALSVYSFSTTVTPATYVGCYNDNKNVRIMERALSDASMTTELCEATCDGSTYFGLQYAVECWCGDDTTNYEVHGESTACDRACGGAPDEFCGGYSVMSVWAY